ncbi:MAG TPA: hypothetical protein VMZ22_07660, partial [Acidimicrobiales bacterium]|nr:hypothetical protein [Acidimicrobiales bacterium]
MGFADRVLFGGLRDAILDSPATNQTWLMHYAGLYWRTQAMRVRRVARGGAGDDSVALSKIIRAVSSDPSVTTRSDYVQRYV